MGIAVHEQRLLQVQTKVDEDRFDKSSTERY